MASQAKVTTAVAGTSSPKLVTQKTIVDMLQDVSKRIQSYGPGPYTPEQAKELERLKHIYVRFKSEHEKAIQDAKTAAVSQAQNLRVTAVMTPVTQVLAPVHVTNPGMVQMAKIAPATTAQVTTVLPANTMTRVVSAVQPAATAKTILPQSSLQQVQTHNVVMNPATIQQMQRTSEVAQMKVTSPQGTQLHVTHTPVQAVTLGQQLSLGGKPLVAQALPVSGIKTGVTTTDRPMQVTQGTPQTITLQRTLVPNKSPVSLPITLAPSGTVSATVPGGSHSVTNIAPAPVAASASKALHGASQPAGVRADTSSPQPNQVLSKRRLQELLREIDPREQMDDDVEDLLLQIADDFIESVVSASCQIAKHRKSSTLEVRDVQLHLERCWNMWVPGFGSDEVRPFKKQATTEAHKQRLALIRKSMKK